MVANIFRFIDALHALKSNEEFHKCHQDFYPCELELKKVSHHNLFASFLDLSNRMFATNLHFTKRPFSILNNPYILFP